MTTIARIALVTLVSMVIVPSGRAGLIPGGGPAASDCYVELDVQGVNGTSNKVTCVDGDPCDVDDGGHCDGTCTFDLQACLNQPGIGGCNNTGTVTLKKPRFKGAHAVLAADSVNTATAPTCSPFARVAVKTKHKGRKPGTGMVTVTAVSTEKPKRDADKLTLVCVPRTGPCPPPTTTTSTTLATAPPTTATVATTTSTSTSLTTSTVTTTTTTTTTLPPGACPGLGVRNFSFSTNSHVFSSAIWPDPIDVAFSGSLTLCAGATAADGSAPLSVASDSFAGIQVTSGAGFFCAKLDAAGSSGQLYCDGGFPVDVDYSLDSHGAGANDPPVIVTGGNPGPAGSAYLTASVRTVLCPAGPPAPGGPPACIGEVKSTTDCFDPTKVDFSQVAPTTLPLSTGNVLAHILNPVPGSLQIMKPMDVPVASRSKAGEAFDCASWQTEDGPGILVVPFLLTDSKFGAIPAGDVANVVVLDD